MRLFLIFLFATLSGSFAKDCSKVRKANSKLFCYYSKLTDIDGCYCSHVILPANADVKSVERVRQVVGDSKILVTVNEFNRGLIRLLKNTKVDGLEIDLKKLSSKNDISDFISTVRSKIGSHLYLALSVPARSEILAKYYDFKVLSKHADTFILQTAFLGASNNVTFHPSRLSGIWDMQNTDSMVDLVSGLGAPLSKVVIAAPVQAFHFTLQNDEYSAVGSPATELKSITRDELCDQMNKGTNWTLERDEDQAGPYIFDGKKWIAFEDTSSMDIKAKYSRVRGLAGLALKDVSQDGGLKCGDSLLETAYNGLSRQSRAPRQAILHSLEREILETPQNSLASIHVSPFRISRVIDVEGNWHVVRQDTRTEFTCTRQGYYVHPRSCNRFYRCVKFDQLVDDYNVFEFDCPAGLAFDERVEVCVWPGSLPQGQPCAGSSEIAPVPREKFQCPHEQGYYADPENCRWFFACLDHGRSEMTAYEFRCPFGLVFDADRLMCEWYWLVPKCGGGSGLGINLATEYYYGGYSGSGNYQTVDALQAYNGLGALGVIKLGGVAGAVQQPIVSSNIGVSGYQGIGGLSRPVTQSLYNAGLLRGNLAGGFYNSGVGNINVINTAGLGGGVGAGIVQENYHLAGINRAGAQLISNVDLNAKPGYIGVTQTYAPSTANAQSAYGHSTVHFDSANLNVDGNFGARTVGLGVVTQPIVAVQQNAGLIQAANAQAAAANAQIAAANAASQYQSSLQNYNQGARAGIVVGNQQATVAANSGSLYNAGYVQNAQSVHNVGTQGNIDIVGGGYSAVSQPIASVGVANVQIGISQPTIKTPLITPTYSVVPAVTPVPIPSVKTEQRFEGYQGGVIANLPELQFKIHEQPKVLQTGAFVTASTPATIIADQRPLFAAKGNAQGALGGANSFVYHSQDYSKSGGYVYSKPTIAFEEGSVNNIADVNVNQNVHLVSSTVRPEIIVEPKVPVAVNVQETSGYVYPKPQVHFQEVIPSVAVSVPSSPTSVQPVVTNSYSYSTTPKPVTFLAERIQPLIPLVQPAIRKPVINYHFKTPQVVVQQPQVYVSSTPAPLVEKVATYSVENNGYQYSQPAVQLVEEPIQRVQPKIISTFSIRQPINTVAHVPLAIHQNEFDVRENVYAKPAVNFEAVSLSPPSITYTTQRPVPFVQNTVVKSEVPAFVDYSVPTQEISKINLAPAVVTQHHYQRPAITRYTYKDVVQSVTPVQPIVVPKIPLISTTPQPVSFNFYSTQKQGNVGFTGYSYPKPEVAFVEEPKINIQQPVEEIPFVKKTAYITGQRNYVNQFISSTPAPPVVVENYQAPVVTNFVDRVVSSTPAPPVVIGNYQAPVVTNYVDQVVSSTPAPPVVVENYQAPVVTNYVDQIVSSTPAPPVFVSNYQVPLVKNEGYQVLSSTPAPPLVVQNYQVPNYQFDEANRYKFVNRGSVRYSNLFNSTPKPTYISTVASVIPKITSPAVQPQFYLYDSRLTTPKPIVSEGYSYPKPAVVFDEKPIIPATFATSTENFVPLQTVTTSRPIVRYSFSSLDSQYAPKPVVISTPSPFISTFKPIQPIVVEDYQAPIAINKNIGYEYQDYNSFENEISSTPKPTFISTIASVRPKVVNTVTEAPFYYYDSRLTSQNENLLAQRVVSTTTRPTEAYSLSTLESYSTTPIITSPVRTRVRVTTSKPPAVYLPQRTRILYTSTTQPSQEYLPVEKLSTISLPVEVTTPNVYLPVRSRVTTTSLPILDDAEISTRRPAQIVTVQGGRTIIKQNDFLPFLPAKLGAQCTCGSNNLIVRKKQKIIVVDDEEDDDDGYVVDNNDSNGIAVENYQYEPQKVVDITPLPQVTLQSSTLDPVLTSTYRIRTRQRTRPVFTDVIEEYREGDDKVSDGEIVKAVKTGLKLVKQAAKEGAREGAEEAIQTNNYRIRDKIDCQRAGLFRHPNQCNKFYSCKWDCKKEKYVVHTFNCPIQLTFDSTLGACNWPSQGPACAEDTLLPVQ